MDYGVHLEQFMYDFVNEAEQYDELWADQLRSLFTSVCLVYGIEADTYRCDRMLEYIYDSISHIIDISYENFYNDMIKYIV